jgi:hypothetical protein
VGASRRRFVWLLTLDRGVRDQDVPPTAGQGAANRHGLRFTDLESGRFLAALSNGSSLVANLQQQSAATKTHAGGD